jgi:hypothetical protein
MRIIPLFLLMILPMYTSVAESETKGGSNSKQGRYVDQFGSKYDQYNKLLGRGEKNSDLLTIREDLIGILEGELYQLEVDPNFTTEEFFFYQNLLRQLLDNRYKGSDGAERELLLLEVIVLLKMRSNISANASLVDRLEILDRITANFPDQLKDAQTAIDDSLIILQQSIQNQLNTLSSDYRSNFEEAVQSYENFQNGQSRSNLELQLAIDRINATIGPEIERQIKNIDSFSATVDTIKNDLLRLEFSSAALQSDFENRYDSLNSYAGFAALIGGLMLVVLSVLPLVIIRQKKELDELREKQKSQLERLGEEMSHLSKKLGIIETSVAPLPQLQKESLIFSEYLSLLPRQNPYVVGPPVDERIFFGRSDVIQSVLRGIHGNHYYILGDRRSGKTSLLRRLNEKIEGINHPQLAFYTIPLDFQRMTEEDLFRTLCEGLWEAAKRANDRRQVEEISTHSDLDFQTLVDGAQSVDDFREIYFHLYRFLASTSERELFFVLLIDEFDKINEFGVSTKEQFRSIFMHGETQGLRLVAAGGELEIWDRSSPLNFFVELSISRLSSAEARRLIIEPSKGVVNWDDEVMEYIIKQTERKAYEIQKLCSSLVDFAFERRAFKIDGSLFSSFQALATKRKEDEV